MSAKPKRSGTDEVSEFIRGLSPELGSMLGKARASILAADSSITEHVKWKAPSFIYEGDDRITFNLGRNDRFHIVFHRGTGMKEAPAEGRLIEDPTGLLRWITDDRATIEMGTAAEVEEHSQVLTILVTLWVEKVAQTQ